MPCRMEQGLWKGKCPSTHSPAASVCCEFAAVGRAGRIYRWIAARPAPFSTLVCSHPRRAFWNSVIRRSVCPVAAYLGSRHADCLQLSHRWRPDVQTADPSMDGRSATIFGLNCHLRGAYRLASPDILFGSIMLIQIFYLLWTVNTWVF